MSGNPGSGISPLRTIAVVSILSPLGGYGANPSGNNEAWLAVIPEPGSGVVLLAVAGFAITRRRYCRG